MKRDQVKIGVVGAGRMGLGIAAAFACAGHMVDLFDAKERSAKEEAEFFQRVKSEIFGTLSLFFSCFSDVPEGNDRLIEMVSQRVNIYHISQIKRLDEAEIIFEAAPEIQAVKKAVLTQIGDAAQKDAVVASTTSTLAVDTLAGFISRPERFLNTHWLNPAYLMPLVEVSPGKKTSPEVCERVFQLLESMGKIPVKCAPSPGFIVPRIQALAMNEAARLAEEGVASVEDIDKASRFGFGLRFAVLGLLEFIDWGGGDILYYADNYLKDALQAERFQAPRIIEEKMRAGEIGMKSGQGFFDFSRRDLNAYQRETIKKFVDLLRHLGLLTVPAEINPDDH